MDISLLVMAHKIGLVREEAITAFPELATIPYESEHAYSASLHRMNQQPVAFVKGAFEKLLPMCTTMAMPGSDTPIDAARIEAQANALATEGYRVLALASGPVMLAEGEVFSEEHLQELTLNGLVGIIDPLRTELKPQWPPAIMPASKLP